MTRKRQKENFDDDHDDDDDEIQSVRRTLRDYGAKARLRSLIGEYGDFQILRSLNENPNQDFTCTANVNTRNERCEKKGSRFLSSAKRQFIEID